MGDGSITLTLFTALVTCGTGLMAAVALGERSNFPVRVLAACGAAVLVSLLAGAVAAVSNLGRPALIFGVLSNPGTPIFEQFVGMMALVVIDLVYLLLLYRGAEASTTSKVAVLGALVGLVLVVILGRSLVMPWRAAWNTWTLVLAPIGWMSLFASAGYALMAWRAEDDPRPTVIAGTAVAALACVAVYLAVLGLSGQSESMLAAQRALTGEASGLFWVGIVGCGVVVPLIASFIARRACAAGGFLALAGALVGSGATHLLVVALGTRAWQFFG